MAQQLGTPVTQPPADGITRLRWSKGGRLLAASWDQCIKVYDQQGSLRSTFSLDAPVLDGCFQDDTTAFAGQLDGCVSRLDLTTMQHTPIGSHTDGVKCTEWLETKGLLATASWDGTLRYWDPRSPPHAAAVLQVPLPGAAYSLAVTSSHVIAATSGRHVHIYNVNRLDALEQPPRESSLKYQTRCIAAFTGSPSFALGSVEGRVAMEILDPSPAAQEAKYAFKCHRRAEAGVDVVYPVNAITYHPVFGTFATGGGDGVVNIWDGNNKKRLFQITGYNTSVASLAFSYDGGMLAVAASYVFEHGEQKEPQEDQIFLRPVVEAEVKPKPRKVAG